MSVARRRNSATANNGGYMNPQHHAKDSSLSNSFQKGLARWTKRVSGTIASCGGISQLPSEDVDDLRPEEETHSLHSNNTTSGHSNNNNYTSNNSNSSVRKVHSHDGTTGRERNNNNHNQSSGLPPRKHKKVYNGSHHHHNHHHHHHTADHDYDHHTLGTATTATATTSYSTDQGDASIASEMGMEVVMAVRSRDSHDAPGDDAHILQAASSSSSLQQRSHIRKDYQSHTFQAGKHSFTVDRRYSMIRVIGSGAYGVVISAKDAKSPSEQACAIKMVPKAFSDEIDAKRILREIKLLKHFRHENIVALIDMMPPNVKYLEDFNDVYMVADLMETDLHRIIYSKQKLSIDHVQYFIYQTLRGLKYIHSAQVLHRDLKPSNLLVNSNCDLKICDFGLARGVHAKDDERNATMLLTEYVVTRWYRAPEIMLACHEYSSPIDVWSVGCIFAELLLRKPLFPGEDYIDQVRTKNLQSLSNHNQPIVYLSIFPMNPILIFLLIIFFLQLTIISEKLGKLTDAELDFVTSEKAKRFMKKLPKKTPKPFSSVFPGTPNDALDVMRKMLSIQPHKRITVEAALKHAFFEPLHNPGDEPVASSSFDFSFENQKLHRLKLQELIWKEVGGFRPSSLPVAPSRQYKGSDP